MYNVFKYEYMNHNFNQNEDCKLLCVNHENRWNRTARFKINIKQHVIM